MYCYNLCLSHLSEIPHFYGDYAYFAVILNPLFNRIFCREENILRFKNFFKKKVQGSLLSSFIHNNILTIVVDYGYLSVPRLMLCEKYCSSQ